MIVSAPPAAIRPASLRPWLVGLAVVAAVALGFVGVYRYVANYWLYRGFAPPQDPAYVREHGTSERFYVTSAAIGGRAQPVDVYLPPGYRTHPHERYPVLYLLHGFPGRPGAFVATVRLGVVEDVLVARHKMQPLILVMPFGSTGSFTDKEWANGVSPHQGWETFVARDVVRAVDRRYRTIASPDARGLAGLSEGGYGALNIGFHHPLEFRVLESWSGYQQAFDVSAIFGHRPGLLRANSPLDAVARVAPALRARGDFVWFYTGTDDPLHVQNVAFAQALARAHVEHRFFLVRGGHNWALWRGNAARALLAASRHLGNAA
jgi:enterochelin esterase-like enzyme